MRFGVKIEKKYAFMIIGAILVLAGAIYGYAQSPSIFGHEFEELEGVQAKILSGSTACSGSNKAIKTISPETGAVTCETDDVGSGGIQSIAVSTLYTVTDYNAWGSESLNVGSHDVCFLEAFFLDASGWAEDFRCWKSGNTINVEGSQGSQCKYRCLDW